MCIRDSHSLAQNREIVFWIGANSGLINRGNNNQENHKKEINDWLGKSSEENRNATAKIATRLFPQIEWTLSGSQHGMGFEKGWLRGLRICHPEVFERYFSFGIPDGDVPQSFIKKLIDVSGDTSQLKELLLELDSTLKWRPFGEKFKQDATECIDICLDGSCFSFPLLWSGIRWSLELRHRICRRFSIFKTAIPEVRNVPCAMCHSTQ